MITQHFFSMLCAAFALKLKPDTLRSLREITLLINDFRRFTFYKNLSCDNKASTKILRERKATSWNEHTQVMNLMCGWKWYCIRNILCHVWSERSVTLSWYTFLLSQSYTLYVRVRFFPTDKTPFVYVLFHIFLEKKALSLALSL